jgi:hypothetical protein
MRKIVGIALLALCACQNKKADLGNFDLQNFKTDRGGCENKRVNQIEPLKALRPKILGLTENQIIESFGRYDYQILSRRNEKVFVYFLEKGPQCEHIQNPTSSRSMLLYFNAASLVKEVSFQTGGIIDTYK